MRQRTRVLIAAAIILVIGGVVLGVEFWRRAQVVDLPPGSIPVYVHGRLVDAFVPDDLTELEQVSFVDDEEGKTQEGWLLHDVLELYVPPGNLEDETAIVVSSSSREKSVEITWAEVRDVDNMVMFDVSGRGTLKLASKLPGLYTRDEWVQDVNRIDVQ
jgi:hypothetical protein